MDADTRKLLAESIRELLRSPDALVAGLAELGWDEVVSDDEAAAVELLFTEQGRAGVASGALDGVIVRAAGVDLSTRPVAVVHPFASAVSTVTDGRLSVDGVLLADPAPGSSYVVVTGSSVHIVPIDHGSATPVRGFDPASRLRRVRFAVDASPEHAGEGCATTAAARRALACEMVGAGRAMLDIAVDQVTQRHQFGRPIGANQTPRHRLADAYVQLSGAQELVRIAWASNTSRDAAVAKAYAGQAVEATSRACLQLCGAMGLTSEHALGGYVKRARILDALHGGWQQATRAIGEELLTARAVPQGVRV